MDATTTLTTAALAIGPATAQIVADQVHRRRHPDVALRASLGILRLARDFSPAQLEAAAQRAVTLKITSYRALRALITTPATTTDGSTTVPLDHANVRGGEYFQ